MTLARLSRITRRIAILAASLTLATAACAAIGVSQAVAAPAPPPPVACAGGPCWHPALKTSWNWVLSAVPAAPYRAVQMYDVDGYDNSAGNVTALHAAGI